MYVYMLNLLRRQPQLVLCVKLHTVQSEEEECVEKLA